MEVLNPRGSNRGFTELGREKGQKGQRRSRASSIGEQWGGEGFLWWPTSMGMKGKWASPSMNLRLTVEVHPGRGGRAPAAPFRLLFMREEPGAGWPQPLGTRSVLDPCEIERTCSRSLGLCPDSRWWPCGSLTSTPLHHRSSAMLSAPMCLLMVSMNNFLILTYTANLY